MECPHCGDDVASHERDIGFQLPDVLFEMTEAECEARATVTDDLCTLDDERFFIRGVLAVPLRGTDQAFGWGFWAEVSAEDFERYHAHFNDDGTDATPFRGTLANSAPGYPASIGLPLEIRLGAATERPDFRALDTGHPVGREQASGIDLDRLHEIFEDAGLRPAADDRPRKAYKLAASDIRELAPGRGGCYATDRILVDGEPVGFMYRETPDGDHDSGWRFVAGDESDDYMDDADNLGLYDVNILANYDPDIVPLLDTEAPCAFVRDPSTGQFVAESE